jgi:hypothetical protein
MTSNPVLIGRSEDPFRFGMPVHIVPTARRRHRALFRANGSGKSSLIRNMLTQDILAGHGVTVVDPHGQMGEEILDDQVRRHRTNDVIYFNPKNPERVFALNLLECRPEGQRGLIVSLEEDHTHTPGTGQTFSGLTGRTSGSPVELTTYALRRKRHQPFPVYPKSPTTESQDHEDPCRRNRRRSEEPNCYLGCDVA